jgi:hypothetical protein
MVPGCGHMKTTAAILFNTLITFQASNAGASACDYKYRCNYKPLYYISASKCIQAMKIGVIINMLKYQGKNQFRTHAIWEYKPYDLSYERYDSTSNPEYSELQANCAVYDAMQLKAPQ